MITSCCPALGLILMSLIYMRECKNLFSDSKDLPHLLSEVLAQRFTVNLLFKAVSVSHFSINEGADLHFRTIIKQKRYKDEMGGIQ